MTLKEATSSPPRRWRSTWWAGPVMCLGEELGHEVVGLALADELGVLGGGDVLLADPEGHAEALAHGVRGALVVGVGVREGVRGEGAPLELLDDLARGEAGRGVDEDVVEEEDVDRVRREEGELPDAVCELLHARKATRARRNREGSRSSKAPLVSHRPREGRSDVDEEELALDGAAGLEEEGGRGVEIALAALRLALDCLGDEVAKDLGRRWDVRVVRLVEVHVVEHARELNAALDELLDEAGDVSGGWVFIHARERDRA